MSKQMPECDFGNEVKHPIAWVVKCWVINFECIHSTLTVIKPYNILANHMKGMWHFIRCAKSIRSLHFQNVTKVEMTTTVRRSVTFHNLQYCDAITQYARQSSWQACANYNNGINICIPLLTHVYVVVNYLFCSVIFKFYAGVDPKLQTAWWLFMK